MTGPPASPSIAGASGLSWPGTSCIAFPERLAGSRACGEDKVRPVHSPARNSINHDRFGLDTGLGIHKHHAALASRQARVAPSGQDHDHGPEGTAEFRQHVLVARRFRLILTPFQHAAGDKPLQPARQQAGGDTEVLLELVEAREASKASCRISKVHHSPTMPSVADSGHSRSSSLIFSATGNHVPPGYCYIRSYSLLF